MPNFNSYQNRMLIVNLINFYGVTLKAQHEIQSETAC